MLPMSRRRPSAFLAVLCGLLLVLGGCRGNEGGAAAATDAAPASPARPLPLRVALSEAEARAWFEKILPSEEERAVDRIPWRPTLREAFVEAQATGKPILLWQMRGHPLGFT